MFRRVLIALSLIASVAWGSAEPAEGAAAATCLRHEDVDGDGEAEIVLENQYVRIDILSGRAPAVPKVPMWRRLRREPRQTPPPKYTCRFVGPGWIGNVVFKPTGRSWLAQITSGNEVWRGIPEEFEQAVRIREITPGVWRCLKIGVGVCQGTGWCYRSSLSLIDPGQWETRFVEVAGGGRAVVFTQTVSAGDGYAYRYEKRLLLMPADTRLLVERTLTNTGTAKLSSTWYTHAFWGQGQEGRYDEDCWATVPLRAGVGGKTSLELDTEACLISNPAEANYWGALDGEFVGDAWFACGNHRRSEVFLTMLAEIPAFYRVWTWSPTYSLEPFRLIDLAPGAVERWAEVLACGVGLDRVDTHDGTAAYSASVRPGTEDTAATVTITAAPFCEIRNATLHLAIRRANGSREQVEETITAAGPTAPFSIRLDRMADGLPLQVQLGLDTGAEPSAVAALARTGWMTVRPAEIGSGRQPEHASGAAAVILGPFERDARGVLVPNRAAGFLLDYLRLVGFVPRLYSDRDVVSADALRDVALVASAGLRVLPVESLRGLEGFVQAGGGLVICGPIDPSAGEFTDLLPIAEIVSTIRPAMTPRDGSREFVRAWTRRYQLTVAEDHPVVQGLPFFPERTQDVGTLQVLTPRPGAVTVLRYATPAGLLPEVTSPALVLSDYGAGRVGVLANPVDWGLPGPWCLWSRVGEHHRVFFGRLALWAAEGALAPLRSKPPSSDCRAQELSE